MAMSVLLTKNKKELIVSCKCGCDEGVHIRIDDSYGYFAFVSYFNSNFYRDQRGASRCLREKIKKIWAIIRNKDFYYSDIIMTRADFQEFKAFVNQFDG